MGNQPYRRRMQESSRRRAAFAIMTASLLAIGGTASAQPAWLPVLVNAVEPSSEVPMKVRFTRRSGAREHDWGRIQHSIRRRQTSNSLVGSFGTPFSWVR